jgi:hypothetical protein
MVSNLGSVFNQEDTKMTITNKKTQSNWNQEISGLGRNPISPLVKQAKTALNTPRVSMGTNSMAKTKSVLETPKTMRKPSAQTYLKNVSSLGRFGVISHHYDE